MADDTIKDAISENAAGPQRVRGDEGEVEQHDLKDQIAADKHVAQKDARRPGFRLSRVRPPGAR